MGKMNSENIDTQPRQAAEPDGNGCLPGYILPPLAVIVVGCLLAGLTLNRSVIHGSTSPASMNLALDPTRDSAPLSTGIISPIFTDEVQYWAEEIQSWAGEMDIDPDLAATVMQIESCGDPQATSRVGARGLFQVMPYHFSELENYYDPDTNARRGLNYLRKALELSGGDPRLALAGYNGGVGIIGLSESSWAAETIRYAYWGSGIYDDATSGADNSQRLGEWLNAGGSSLCNQAHARLGLP